MERCLQRKKNRLTEYDYSAPGAYFITVCTRERKPLLGKIESVGGGVYDAPSMVLSEYGRVLNQYIRLMDEQSSHISVDKYVIMPNHFHLILRVTGSENGASTSAAPYEHDRPLDKAVGDGARRHPANDTIPKFVSLLKRYCNREYGQNIWQRSYHDHIIRGEEDYRKIWEYIDQNAQKWALDCFYTA